MSPRILLGGFLCRNTAESWRCEGADVAVSSGRGGTGHTGVLGAANAEGWEGTRGPPEVRRIHQRKHGRG